MWIQETETQDIEQPDAARASELSMLLLLKFQCVLKDWQIVVTHFPPLPAPESVGLWRAAFFLWRNIAFRLRWGMDFWQPISKKYGDSLGQEPFY